jgi:predicted transcriptional regulator
MIAKELTTTYRLKQKEAATLLAVSQPAISLYYRKIRGRAIDLENDRDIGKLVEDMAKSLVESKPSRRELIPMYCEVCRTIRAKGLLCKLHKAFDPAIDIDTCGLCVTDGWVKCS